MCSIFIASSVTNFWPLATESPAATSTAMIRPGIGERIAPSPADPAAAAGGPEYGTREAPRLATLGDQQRIVDRLDGVDVGEIDLDRRAVEQEVAFGPRRCIQAETGHVAARG